MTDYIVLRAVSLLFFFSSSTAVHGGGTNSRSRSSAMIKNERQKEKKKQQQLELFLRLSPASLHLTVPGHAEKKKKGNLICNV